MFAAEYEPDETGTRRRATRVAAQAEGAIQHDGLERALCRVVSVSALGVRIETYTPLRRGLAIWLTLPEVGRVAAQVRWAQDFTAGCEFRVPLSAKQFAALSGIAI